MNQPNLGIGFGAGTPLSRRQFSALAAAGALGAVVAPGAALSRPARARAMDELRVGVIGCGGRGTGAAINALEADEGARIVALADLFADRVDAARGYLTGDDNPFASRVDLPADRVFTGFDGFERLLALHDVDVVILATAPHFRPLHFQAAVQAGKHVFMEKPAAVDPAGVRRVIAAGELARQKRLCVVAGTQRRYEDCYTGAMSRIHEGVRTGEGGIGRIVAARCSWNQGGLWVHERRPEYSDMEWQCRNWLYFTWLSGDHIVEQHVHNLDVINWALEAVPVSCCAMGGRQVRTEAKYGNVFDHFAVEFEYPGGVNVLSMCRQTDGCAGRVDEVLFGTRGRALTRPGHAEIQGEHPWRFTGDQPNPYAQEHKALFSAIRAGTPVNEAQQVAESTLTAIMGRMSAYTGQVVTWEQAMKSTLDLTPPRYAMGPLPGAPVAVPGRTPLV